MAEIRMDYEHAYKLAKKYYEENGNLLVPRGYKTSIGESLGRWVLNQREKYNKGKLTAEQIKALEDIGMVWSLGNSGSGEKFQDKFNRLLPVLTDYFNKNGNLLIPCDYEIEGDKLGKFISDLRSAKRDGGQYKGQLTNENIKKLNNILMVWDLKESQWEEIYSKAEAVYKKYGTIISGNVFVTDGDKSLGKWFISQRTNYKEGTLSSERIDKLEKLDMVWDPLEEVNWNSNYEKAKEFYETNGHLLIPDAYDVDGVKLGRWIQRMRKAYKGDGKLKISDEQIKLLNDINMVWDVKEETWDNTFNLLKDCYKKFGSINVPVSFVYNGVNIGIWLNNQRQDYKNKTLSKDRIKKLESLDIEWTMENNNVSLKEKIIFHYLKKAFPGTVSNYKPAGWNGKELDIFIPSLSLAVEYDGEHWHKDVKKDIKKNKMCQDIGVKLIRVREPGCPVLNDTSIDLYLNNLSNDVVIDMIKTIVNKIIKIYSLSVKIDVDFNRDYFDIVKLYLSSKPSAEWDEMYKLAKKYYENNGDLLIPRGYIVNNKNLGDWLYIQRQAYKPKTKYIVTPKQIKLLESIGMVWDVNEYKFREKYLMAKKFFEEHGHLKVSNQLKYGSTDLVDWVRIQRFLYKNNKLSQERVELLNDISIEW